MDVLAPFPHGMREAGNHGIMEWVGLERSWKNSLRPWPWAGKHSRGQVVPRVVQAGAGHFQGWRFHNKQGNKGTNE